MTKRKRTSPQALDATLPPKHRTFAFAQLPRYLLRDRDAIFCHDLREQLRGGVAQTAAQSSAAFRSPRRNAPDVEKRRSPRYTG